MFWNCKSHPGWGLDDQLSIPALDKTAECNTFAFFNILMLIEKKLPKAAMLVFIIKESLAVSKRNNIRAPLLRGVTKVEILNLCAGYFYNFYSNEKIEHTTSVIVSRYSFEKVRGDTALHPYGCTVQGFITKLQICSINSS